MIYPKFLKNNSTIGICAPSSGVGDKIFSYEQSLNTLIKDNYLINESLSVRNNGIVSNTIENRAVEFNEMIKNDDIELLLIARGGEFLYDVLPYLDLEKIINHPKWIMGYSDPTSILFSITTKYDIATIYGFNSTSYDIDDKCVVNNLNIIKGDLIKQNSFNKYIDYEGFWHPVKWNSNLNELKISGRIIGGCIEVLKDLIGTNFHDIEKFNTKYSDDGIIWYFDIYSMNSSDFYRTLLQFKYANWFNNVKCILLSRINNKIEEFFTYEEAIEKVFPDIPYIIDCCFGHTFPKMTIINGSICKIEYKNNKGTIEFELR